MFRFYKLSQLFVAILVLSACEVRTPIKPTHQASVIDVNTYPYDMTAGVEVIESPVSTDEVNDPSPESVTHVNAAVSDLLKTAYQLQKEGDYANASANLERAQRIAPRNPLVYRQLAWVRFAQKDYAQAEEIAKRVSTLTTNQQLQTEMALLIEQCQIRVSQ